MLEVPAVAATPSRIDGTLDRGEDLALVLEQAADPGGNERIVAALLDRYPAAQALAPTFASTILTGSQRLHWARSIRLTAGGRGRRRWFLAPLYCRRMARVRLEPATVVLSLTQPGWSPAVTVPPGARHVCYSSGLPRALYHAPAVYRRDEPALLRPLLWAAGPPLRAHHRRIMRRPDRLITNSRATARALERVHGRPAEVIHPPVRTDFFTPGPGARDHVLVVARLTGQKRVEAVLDAFAGLPDRLVVVGNGIRAARLRERAPANVGFTGYVDDEELRELYRRSRALVCPSVEDFGIVMAEAQATGTPVIAPRAGGALEIVRDGETGILLDRGEPADIAAAVRALDGRSFSPAACRAAGERFSEGRFLEAFARVLAEERVLAGGRPQG